MLVIIANNFGVKKHNVMGCATGCELYASVMFADQHQKKSHDEFDIRMCYITNAELIERFVLQCNVVFMRDDGTALNMADKLIDQGITHGSSVWMSFDSISLAV